MCSDSATLTHGTSVYTQLMFCTGNIVPSAHGMLNMAVCLLVSPQEGYRFVTLDYSENAFGLRKSLTDFWA